MRILTFFLLNRHSPLYHRSIKEPPCCHGFTVESMKTLLETAGLKPDVHVVHCYHYLECLDQVRAKEEYTRLPPYEGSICEEDYMKLPKMLCIGSTYFERDVFPFVVAYGQL